MKSIRPLTLSLAIGLSAVTIIGCGTSPSSPGIEPEIIETADSFGYQVSAIENYTGSRDYAWQNAGTAANVDLSSEGSSGTATLLILDAEGGQVFSGALTQDGSFLSSSGTAGDWTIRVIYDSFSGTVNFRVERDT